MGNLIEKVCSIEHTDKQTVYTSSNGAFPVGTLLAIFGQIARLDAERPVEYKGQSGGISCVEVPKSYTDPVVMK